MSDLTLPLLSRRTQLSGPSGGEPTPVPQALSARLDALLGAESSTLNDEAVRKLAAGGYAMERPAALARMVAHVALSVAVHGGRLHVLSLNDAAQRLGQNLSEPLGQLGIGSAVIAPTTPLAARAAAYTAPIVFLGAQDAGLDLLRARTAGATSNGIQATFSRLADRPPALRLAQPEEIDLCLVLDGEDTLITRSLTGIVLNAGTSDASDPTKIAATEALSVAALMGPKHFRINKGEVQLGQEGRTRLATLVQTLGAGWNNPASAELCVTRALAALHLWREGADFSIAPDGDLILSDALNRHAHNNPGLDPRALIAARHYPDRTGQSDSTALERICLRDVLQRYPRLSCFVVDAQRHTDELRSAYGLSLHGRVTHPTSEMCLHPALLTLPPRGAVFLSGGHSRDADSLRRVTGVATIEWPCPATPPDAPCVVLSQSGHCWPDWAKASNVRRIRLLPARPEEPAPGVLTRALCTWPGVGLLRRAVFAYLEEKRLAEDRHQRQALFDFDHACREAVRILGSKNA